VGRLGPAAALSGTARAVTSAAKTMRRLQRKLGGSGAKATSAQLASGTSGGAAAGGGKASGGGGGGGDDAYGGDGALHPVVRSSAPFTQKHFNK